jgi:hypothetical protein
MPRIWNKLAMKLLSDISPNLVPFSLLHFDSKVTFGHKCSLYSFTKYDPLSLSQTSKYITQNGCASLRGVKYCWVKIISKAAGRKNKKPTQDI